MMLEWAALHQRELMQNWRRLHSAEPLERLELGFTDGLRSEADLRDRVAGRGGVFRPLADVDCFRQVQVESEAGTIVWPNGVDFCPDVLYSLATGQPIDDLQAAGVS